MTRTRAKSRGKWPLAIAIAAGVVLLLWLILVGWLYVSQRELMYYPARYQAAPNPNGPPIQVVSLNTSDGERLVAWYLPPQDDKPVILYFGGNADALALQQDRWRQMADVGVGFLAVGYRGFSGSTGHPTEAGLHEDALTAYRWLAARQPASRIVIHGFSLGTGVAVRLAAEQPARALVLEAPFTAAVDMAGAQAPFVPSGLLMHDRYLSRKWIKQIHMPVLIVHGDRDSIIPFASGQKLYRLANQPKAFVRMPGSDHMTLVADGLYPHVWRFLGIVPPAAGGRETEVVYSDLCTHADDGKVDGLRITVRALGAEPRVTGQYAADGVLPQPTSARVTGEAGGLAFDLTSGGARFIGQVEGDHVTVRGAWPGAEPFRLERPDADAPSPLCG